LTNPVFKGNTFTPSLSDNAVFYVTDSNANCASIATPVQAIINPLPDKPFLGNDTALCPGETIVLNAGNYTSYFWQDNSTASSFVVNQSGNYWVSVKSGGVCASSDSIAINVLENCDDVYFPSAFSPNGDGNNEHFGPLGNLFMVKLFSLKVFNRWGQMVYSSINPYQRWDGNNINKAQHTSNFTYIATYYFRGVPRMKKGSLLLLR
jgi:gliding motility-associated-like protein